MDSARRLKCAALGLMVAGVGACANSNEPTAQETPDGGIEASTPADGSAEASAPTLDGGTGLPTPTTKLPARPNIVLILVDDMGWSDLGAFGGEIDTPNLDRLATNGIRFTQCHNTSKCFPSRATLLTGAYAQQSGMAESWSRPMRNVVTLGEVLRSTGYRTLMAGKHHGAEKLTSRGFDRAYGLLDGSMNYFNPGLRRPGEPEPAQKRSRTWMDDGKVFTAHDPDKQDTFGPGFYATDAFTDRSLEYLSELHGNQPFFLYVAYTAPHDPLQAWPEDIEKYAGKYDVGYEAIREARYKKMLADGVIDAEKFPLSEPTHAAWASLSTKTQADQARRMQVYAAMIDRLDQNVGRLLQALEDAGKLDNTLILFASDNGASAEQIAIGTDPIGTVGRWASLGPDWANVSNTPFRYFKNDSFQGGISTPLIAYWPKAKLPGGAVSHFPLHFIDVMPTLVELSGAIYPRTHGGDAVTPMQGISFAPLLRGETISGRPPLFWEWGTGGAARRSDWKIVRRRAGGEAWELYDLSGDMTETHDLAAEHPNIVADLSDSWQAWTAWTATLAPPIAKDDHFTITAGESARLSILSNDSPSSGGLDPASVIIHQLPRSGSVQVDPGTGDLLYTHTGSAPDKDELTYSVRDTSGAPSHRAVVTLSIQ